MARGREPTAGRRALRCVLGTALFAAVLAVPAIASPFGNPEVEHYCLGTLNRCETHAYAEEDGAAGGRIDLKALGGGRLGGAGAAVAQGGYRASLVVPPNTRAIEFTLDVVVRESWLVIDGAFGELRAPPRGTTSLSLDAYNLCPWDCVAAGHESVVVLNGAGRVEDDSRTLRVEVRRECSCALHPGHYYLSFVAEAQGEIPLEFLSGRLGSGRIRASIDVVVQRASFSLIPMGVS